MSLTNCRFYENKYPDLEEFVMVNVKQIAEMGAYVKLLEYDNIDGMILLSELSRRRIRSIQKLIRVGRNEVVVVLRVDKDKGYIDLSKRRVSAEDIIKCEERFNKGKMVASIMRHVAEKTKTPMETLYQTIGWPLNKKYGHAVDAFKLSITNPDVWSEVTFPNDVVKNELQTYISKRLTPQPTKVRADVEVTCFRYDGIDAIKSALRAAEAPNTNSLSNSSPPTTTTTTNNNSTTTENNNTSTSPSSTTNNTNNLHPPNATITTDAQIKVKLVSPPLYVLTSQCLDKNTGIQGVEHAISQIKSSIEKAGGSCKIIMAPKAVTETDDAELQALMERREKENAEVSGDESVSESDEGGILETI